jgi:hypothetical protein
MAKLGLILSGLFFGVLGLARAEATTTIRVGFVTKESQKFYDEIVKPYWNQLSDGRELELVSLTPYNGKGELNFDELAKNLERAPADIKTIYLHWNEPVSARHESVVQALRKKTEEGVKVAFFAGLAYPGGRTVPLGQTVAGQIPKALILGELIERERLPAQHFYGPELFSAFRAENSLVAGLAPLQFVSRWSRQASGKTLDESLLELRRRKMKSKSLWPSVEELLSRP